MDFDGTAQWNPNATLPPPMIASEVGCNPGRLVLPHNRRADGAGGWLELYVCNRRWTHRSRTPARILPPPNHVYISIY